MLQREVVDRLTAAASTSERGSLSVLVQLSFRVKRELNAPPEAFWPRPDVQSTVISLEPHAHPPAQSALLRQLLREGFGQRRKTLANSLGIGRRRPADLLQRAGLPDRIRAQDLTNDQWLTLASL
jgi:16S rRNA (adenine1518-N6/adenine1519-N6)-dimethyltransferase